MFKRPDSAELTSLNLQTPPKAEQQQASQSSASQPCRSLYLTPEGRAQASAEVTRRTQEWMKSGLKPTTFFCLFDPKVGGPVVAWSAEKKPLLPLFTSPFSASDYASVVKCEAKIAGYEIKALPTLAQAWVNAGISSLMIDFCPRCNYGTFLRWKSCNHRINSCSAAEQQSPVRNCAPNC